MADARRTARGGRLLGAGVVAAVALLVVGLVLAFRGYHAQAGPEGVVRSYFAALARGDAPAALAYGTVPDGPRTLLTSPVLARQQHAAPLHKFSVTGDDRHGSTASVHVRYELDFPGSPQRVTSTVPVRRHGDVWRLTSVAVATELRTDTAAQRIIGLGPAPAGGESLLFPGALPVSFDTPLLALDPTSGHVEFGSSTSTDVDVVASPRGQTQARTAVHAALVACLDGRAGPGDLICPQPSERYVPGSLRGTLVAGGAPLEVVVANDAAGILQISGTVTVNGTWQRLTFANQAMTGHGRVQLSVSARAYAVEPLRTVWADT
ncbi:hypothetical protein [uncultured Jatrophihabitans sp.]|uniref:hypothetical protein n=1 Tax=uncultured Jatrophihabitans sp. TaxID=1610747 RepID=UPI0035CB8D11